MLSILYLGKANYNRKTLPRKGRKEAKTDQLTNHKNKLPLSLTSEEQLHTQLKVFLIKYSY